MTTDSSKEKPEKQATPATSKKNQKYKNQPKSTAKKKFSPSARSSARQRVLQALYQWQFTQQAICLIEAQFLADTEMEMDKIDLAYFKKLLYDIPEKITELDAAFTPLLDRKMNQLDPIELIILRIGCYELIFGKDIPFKVAINEAVELAKQFGAEQSHKYVNSILDKFAQLNCQ